MKTEMKIIQKVMKIKKKQKEEENLTFYQDTVKIDHIIKIKIKNKIIHIRQGIIKLKKVMKM